MSSSASSRGTLSGRRPRRVMALFAFVISARCRLVAVASRVTSPSKWTSAMPPYTIPQIIGSQFDCRGLNRRNRCLKQLCKCGSRGFDPLEPFESIRPTVFLIHTALHCEVFDYLVQAHSQIFAFCVSPASRARRYPRLLPCSVSPKRSQPRVGLKPELRRARPDRISNITRREMAIMLLDHSRIGVAEILRNHQQRHAIHDRM